MTTSALDQPAPGGASQRIALIQVAALILAALIALIPGAAHAIAQSASLVPGLRLPRDIVPLAYDAKLRVDPTSDVFSGTIEIKVRVLEPTDLV